MKMIPIKVESHSGHKSDEYPVCFYWGNLKFEIKEISDRWFQATSPDYPVADYFKVRTESKNIYILKHQLKTDQWFLVSPEDPLFQFSTN